MGVKYYKTRLAPIRVGQDVPTESQIQSQMFMYT